MARKISKTVRVTQKNPECESESRGKTVETGR